MSPRRPTCVSQCYVSIKQLDSSSQRQFHVSCSQWGSTPVGARKLPMDDAASARHRPKATSSRKLTSEPLALNRRHPIQPLEPKLLPKFRFYLADFPWSHCSIDQSLLSSESGCGYRYGRARKGRPERFEPALNDMLPHRKRETRSLRVNKWISGRFF